MRIKRLDLKAVGPFTNRVLEFNSQKPGLHILFGPNEAGKSSSLRALKALFYGFPERTPDNFIHANNQLLVGGVFENDDGRSLAFQRRKKRKADIMDMDGKPLNSSDLEPFLQGIPLEIFESLYGIDYDTLVKGGEDILAQKGEIGQALFSAGAGLASLRRVIEQFEKEAGDLFKPSGKVPEINKAVKRYRELQKEARALSLSAREYKQQQKKLITHQKNREQLEKARNAASKELSRLERLAQAIPELAALENLQQQLHAMGDVTLLPPDFSERHQQINQAIRDACLSLDRDYERQKQIDEKKNSISFNKEILRQAEKIDDFHQRLGEYRKGRKDKPERNGMRISLRKEAAALLKQVRPDLPLEKVETLRPVMAKKKEFRN